MFWIGLCFSRRDVSLRRHHCPAPHDASQYVNSLHVRGVFDWRYSFGGLLPLSDFLVLLASHGCVILKLKSSGRKYSSIPCASLTTAQSADCGDTSGKCATLRAVFICNGGRFGLRNGTYCNPKRAILESKTARIAARFILFYY